LQDPGQCLGTTGAADRSRSVATQVREQCPHHSLLGNYALMQVRVRNDLIHWMRFFLNGVAQAATKGRDVFQGILALRNRVEHDAASMGRRAGIARRALNLLYRKPIVDAGDLERALAVTTPTANSLIRLFLEKGILTEITGQQRGRVYSFEPYLRLFLS